MAIEMVKLIAAFILIGLIVAVKVIRAKRHARCATCGMPIVGSPVVRKVGGRNLTFCCEGCARAYMEG